MSIIAANKEGVKALKDFSSKVSEGTRIITTETDGMTGVVEQNRGNLGEHAADIQAALDQIKGAVFRGLQPANELAEKLNTLANAYQAIIDKNYYGGGSGN